MNNFLDFLKKYWWLALFFVLFPYIVAFIFYFPFIPPDLGLTYKEWLNFWGIFIGSAIGGLTALYAVYSSLKQNEKFHFEQVKCQEDLNRMKKNEVKPILDFFTLLDPFSGKDNFEAMAIVFKEKQQYEVSKTVIKKQIIQPTLKNTFGLGKYTDDLNSKIEIFALENIGQAPAMKVAIFCNGNRLFPYLNIGINKKIFVAFVFPFTLESENHYLFIFRFIDIYENCYEQVLNGSVLIDNNNLSFTHQQISVPVEIPSYYEKVKVS